MEGGQWGEEPRCLGRSSEDGGGLVGGRANVLGEERRGLAVQLGVCHCDLGRPHPSSSSVT